MKKFRNNLKQKSCFNKISLKYIKGKHCSRKRYKKNCNKTNSASSLESRTKKE